MTKQMVIRMTSEQALPFVRQYNTWVGASVAKEDDAKYCIWCGVVVKDVIRAVMGLRQLDDDTVFVWGMFGDGSNTIDECLAAVHLKTIVNSLPFKLEGAIHPTNTAQQRRAEKNGWHKTDTQIMCGTDDELQEIWERPYKAG